MEVTEEDKQRDTDYEVMADDEPTFELEWDDAPKAKVMKIPIPFVRDMGIKRIEAEIKKDGHNEVTMELFEKFRFTF